MDPGLSYIYISDNCHSADGWYLAYTRPFTWNDAESLRYDKILMNTLTHEYHDTTQAKPHAGTTACL